MKYFSYEKYEIILMNYEISRFARCEIKFAFQHLRSKFFIRIGVFNIVDVSLATRRISLKKQPFGDAT